MIVFKVICPKKVDARCDPAYVALTNLLLSGVQCMPQHLVNFCAAHGMMVSGIMPWLWSKVVQLFFIRFL